MIRYLQKGVVAFTMLGASFSSTSALVASPPVSPTPAKDEYKPEQMILMKEPGKPDRRCVVVSAKKQPDGSHTYQVKALDNGEVMTIHDRVPETLGAVQSTEIKKPATNPHAMDGIKLPVDVTSRMEADLPRARPRTDDPLLNPKVPGTSTAPVVSAKPIAKSVSTVTNKSASPSASKADSPSTLEKMRASMFGKSEKPSPVPCATCPPKQVPSAIAMPGVPATVAKSPQEPLIANMPVEPTPITYGPRLPMTVPMVRPMVNEPSPVALYQAPPDPAKQAVTMERERIEELKESLQTALRPSQRMAAAEELCAPSRITDLDVRAAVMLAAQDDPAGVVRATCIRGMSRVGLRDQAYIALLMACQNDRDKVVREEATFAIEKAAKR